MTTEVLAFDAGSHMFVNVNLTELSSTLLVEVLDPKDESNAIKKTSLLVKGPIDSTVHGNVTRGSIRSNRVQVDGDFKHAFAVEP